MISKLRKGKIEYYYKLNFTNSVNTQACSNDAVILPMILILIDTN